MSLVAQCGTRWHSGASRVRYVWNVCIICCSQVAKDPINLLWPFGTITRRRTRRKPRTRPRPRPSGEERGMRTAVEVQTMPELVEDLGKALPG